MNGQIHGNSKSLMGAIQIRFIIALINIIKLNIEHKVVLILCTIFIINKTK